MRSIESKKTSLNVILNDVSVVKRSKETKVMLIGWQVFFRCQLPSRSFWLICKSKAKVCGFLSSNVAPAHVFRYFLSSNFATFTFQVLISMILLFAHCTIGRKRLRKLLMVKDSNYICLFTLINHYVGLNKQSRKGNAKIVNRMRADFTIWIYF